MDEPRKIINVTCALIIGDENRLFAAQRSSSMTLPFKWELPGGKIEPGESEEQCLIREIKEELNIEVAVLQRLHSNKHEYPAITIKLIPFICKKVAGEILLKEHSAYRWLAIHELLNMDWAEADIPILNNYLKQVNAI